MKKETLCKECCNTIKTTIICDVCGMYLLHKHINELRNEIVNFSRNPITLYMDTTYDFCSLKCLKIFVDSELKKEMK